MYTVKNSLLHVRTPSHSRLPDFVVSTRPLHRLRYQVDPNQSYHAGWPAELGNSCPSISEVQTLPLASVHVTTTSSLSARALQLHDGRRMLGPVSQNRQIFPGRSGQLGETTSRSLPIQPSPGRNAAGGIQTSHVGKCRNATQRAQIT